MEPFIGQIQPFGFNFAPSGWATCDGQLLPISQNTALFSLLGTTYGGDGRTTFALPDLRGRVSLHTGQGPGLTSRPIGSRSGQENSTLTEANLAPHDHKIGVQNTDGDDSDPTTANGFGTAPNDLYLENYSGTSLGDTIGSGQSFTNMPPFLVINWCIALTGVFPSRN